MGRRDAERIELKNVDIQPTNSYQTVGISQRFLLWIIALRLMTATLVLGIGAAIEEVPSVILGLDAALSALASIYLLSSIYLLLLLIDSHYLMQLRLQVMGDLLAVTLLIFLSGEAGSPYSSLYLVVIAYATLVAGKNFGVAATAISTILYVGMIDLAIFDLIPFGSINTRFGAMNFRSAVVVLGFITVSYLSATLSDRLSRIRRELEEKSDYLADLRVFNDNVVESLRSGLITTDLDGNVRTANRSAEMLLEVSMVRLIGKSMDQLFPKQDIGGLFAADRENWDEPQRKEFWAQSGNGQRKYFGLSVSPLFNQRRELIGHIASFQDLTEIKRLQEAVAIKDRMAAMGHLAAAIAHEIRNPLASMHGSVQVLRKATQLHGDEAHLMDIVLRESNRLNKIIEDFLRYARPKPLDLHRIDLMKVAEETVSLLRNNPTPAVKHEIILESPPEPLWINGDSDLMHQLCWNLASNAMKAMPEGGRLQITGRSENSGKVWLQFSDSGIGMSSEELNLVFQPFYSRFSEGLGIGMAIVYQIVEQHGGKIDIRSEKGIGTTVRLEFDGA
jgi:two-component system, NtrC family, sensor histidine kinase PilS